MTYEVLEHLNLLNPAKRTGPNGIPKKYLQMSAHVFAPILMKLYNECIQHEIYLTCLKKF